MSGEFERFMRRSFIRLMRFPAAEEGAVMVEFIIIAPTFLFLVIGTIQYMGISHADAMLQYANYMACRAGTVHYENIARGWDSGHSGGVDSELPDIMEKAARHAMGPIDHLIGGYGDLGLNAGSTDKPLPYSPTGVMDMTVNHRVIQVSETRYMPNWLAVQTDLDLGLPFPWVGACIQAIHRHAPLLTDVEQTKYGEVTGQEFGQHGWDAYATPDTFVSFKAKDALYDMSWITLRSDSNLDMRANNQDSITRHWPLTLSGTDTNEAQPIALPIQARMWKNP